MMLSTLALVLSIGSSQTLATYRAQHRPAAELAALAETALGSDGTVTLDARTATLILNGAPGAVQRALDFLARLDRPLGNVVLTSEIVEASDLDRRGLRVDWRTSSGDLAVGTLPFGRDGLRVALGAERSRTRSRLSSTLQLLEGTRGILVSGEALPFVYRPYGATEAVGFLPADTGLEATATVLGDGRVQLELRLFSGRLEPSGGLRYTETATSIAIPPSSTVVVGELSRSAETSERSLTGVESTTGRERQLLLVSVELEEP